MKPVRSPLDRVRLAGTVIGLIAVLVAGWLILPTHLSAEVFASLFAPHRHAWYALPGVMLSFAALGLLLVPVLLLIAATGVAFGPWLGPIYAMAGCLASASTGFVIGRRIGRARVERLGGRAVSRITGAMAKHGVFAVFLLRKVPLPFLVANVLAGAADVHYRDFVLGTLLGMTAMVVALAGFGYQATRVLDDPTPRTIALATLALAIPMTMAWAINRTLRRRVPSL